MKLMFKYILGVQKMMSYFMSSPPVTEKVPSTKKIDTFYLSYLYILKNVIVPGRFFFSNEEIQLATLCTLYSSFVFILFFFIPPRKKQEQYKSWILWVIFLMKPVSTARKKRKSELQKESNVKFFKSCKNIFFLNCEYTRKL